MEKNAIIAFLLSMAVFGAYFLFFSPKEPIRPPKDQGVQSGSGPKGISHDPVLTGD